MSEKITAAVVAVIVFACFVSVWSVRPIGGRAERPRAAQAQHCLASWGAKH